MRVDGSERAPSRAPFRVLTGPRRTEARRWELWVDPPRDGKTNMEVDAGLLRDIDGSPEPRTVVRFYSWTRPTLSLGRNQKAGQAADLAFCERQGIDIVHRPTGGLAVLHDDEVTYAVVSNEPDRFEGGSVYGIYRRVSEALAEGYRRLGVDAVLAAGTRREPGDRAWENPCFVSQSRYELAVGGRKIVGSAQRRLRRAFLQHGSMPVSLDRELLARATRFGAAGLLEGEMAGLAECLDPVPDRSAIVTALGAAFEAYFGIVLEPVRGGPERIAGAAAGK